MRLRRAGMGAAERLRLGPGFEGLLAFPDRVRDEGGRLLVGGAAQQVKDDEAGHFRQVALAVAPDLLEFGLAAEGDAETVHGDEGHWERLGSKQDNARRRESVAGDHDAETLVLKVEPVFLKKFDADDADVALIDDDLNGFEVLALARAGKACAAVEIELRTVVAADEEISGLVHEFLEPSIEALALMRAGIFKTVEILAFSRDEDGPGLADLLPVLLHRLLQDKAACGMVLDFKSAANGEKVHVCLQSPEPRPPMDASCRWPSWPGVVPRLSGSGSCLQAHAIARSRGFADTSGFERTDVVRHHNSVFRDVLALIPWRAFERLVAEHERARPGAAWDACKRRANDVVSLRSAAGCAKSYARNLGDGVNQAADLVSDATSIPSRNFTPLMTFGNWFWPLQPSPSFRRRRHELEDHQPSGVLRQRAFHADRAMPDRREHAFNRICRAQMVPVLGGKVEERQQRVAILDQAFDGLVVFGRVFLGEGRHRRLRRRAVRRQPDFAQVLVRRRAEPTSATC